MRLLLDRKRGWRGRNKTARWFFVKISSDWRVHYWGAIYSAPFITNLITIQLNSVEVQLWVFLTRSLIWGWDIVEPCQRTFKLFHIFNRRVLIQGWCGTIRGCCKECSHWFLVPVSGLSASISFLTAFLGRRRAWRFSWDVFLNKLFLITIINEIYYVICASYKAIARFETWIKSKRVSLPFFFLSYPLTFLFLIPILRPFQCFLCPYCVLAYILHS